MRLTPRQKELRDRGTAAERTAMKLLIALGEIYGADRLIRITSAHVAGASYKMIGDPGLEFIEDFAKDAKVAVPTTVNPLGMDLERWREQGIPEAFAAKQRRIAEAYRSIGVRESFSCTPYLIGSRPRFGDHVAWAESSAACFANSVIGARTNREGGPSALASAVTGVTPNYGLHLDEGRRATAIVDVKAKVYGMGFSLLGLHVGRELGGGIPYFRGLAGTEADLKWLSASIASASDCAMFHIERRTPEWRRARAKGLPRISVTDRELSATRREFTTGEEADIIGLGSPQLSAEELRQVADLMNRYRPRIPVWVFTSRAAREAAVGSVLRIEVLGGRVLADTCLEVTLLEHVSKTVATPSGKGAVYLPTLCGQKVVMEDIERLFRRYAT
jgi:predicted aconitase